MQHHVFVEHEASSTIAWRRHVGVGNQILKPIQVAIAHLWIWDGIDFREVHGLHVRPANQNERTSVKSGKAQLSISDQPRVRFQAADVWPNHSLGHWRNVQRFPIHVERRGAISNRFDDAGKGQRK